MPFELAQIWGDKIEKKGAWSLTENGINLANFRKMIIAQSTFQNIPPNHPQPFKGSKPLKGIYHY
jgi:hypothetical protein